MTKPTDTPAPSENVGEPFSKGYKTRHGKPVSDACGDERHAECTQTLDKCHCTWRGDHTVMHAYATPPVRGGAEPREREQNETISGRLCSPYVQGQEVLPSMRDGEKAQVILSCLVCGQTGEKAIVHEPSGVWVCMVCREKVRLSATPPVRGAEPRKFKHLLFDADGFGPTGVEPSAEPIPANASEGDSDAPKGVTLRKWTDAEKQALDAVAENTRVNLRTEPSAEPRKSGEQWIREIFPGTNADLSKLEIRADIVARSIDSAYDAGAAATRATLESDVYSLLRLNKALEVENARLKEATELAKTTFFYIKNLSHQAWRDPKSLEAICTRIEDYAKMQYDLLEAALTQQKQR